MQARRRAGLKVVHFVAFAYQRYHRKMPMACQLPRSGTEDQSMKLYFFSMTSNSNTNSRLMVVSIIVTSGTHIRVLRGLRRLWSR